MLPVYVVETLVDWVQHASFRHPDVSAIRWVCHPPTLRCRVPHRKDESKVEEAVTAYGALQHGELAVLPNTAHVLTRRAIDATVDFLVRWAETGSSP